MTFRDPRLLWLLAAIPFATIFLLSREKVRERIARRFMSERLRGGANPARPVRPWLLAAGLLLAAFALAGPSRGFRSVPVMERESNRVLVLDVSNSMLATDLGTSRLAVGKAVARRIIDAWPGRVGLIEFEMQAEVVSPLTSDTDAVAALLDSVEAGELGQPGSDIGEAVLRGMRLVEIEPGAKADLVILSDGEDQGQKLDEAIRRARERNVRVSAVLLGKPSGATIPLAGGELRDTSGKVVTTAANAEPLRRIVSATGGILLENAADQAALEPLLAPRLDSTQRQKEVRVPIDRYQWPLALAFMALFLGSLANRGAE